MDLKFLCTAKFAVLILPVQVQAHPSIRSIINIQILKSNRSSAHVSHNVDVSLNKSESVSLIFQQQTGQTRLESCINVFFSERSLFSNCVHSREEMT